ncbi:MAG: succinate dehydrogenase assembly factor 2 [Caenispirillum bisanense]|nr:succinate dehydrogenase assembly factor 2 [Caenispirillum bisanense]MCA1971531.1 succinate dehydrogenase assembly factor 2 [Caenispirillum sp.]
MDEIRRKRLIYRANHRGMKEADVMIGRFVETHIDRLSPDQVDRLESLMDELDLDIMDWVMDRQPVPARHDTDVFAMLKAFEPADREAYR